MTNKFTDWFVRVFKTPVHPSTQDMREHEKTLDDVQTNAPKRKKQALRHPPERK